MISNFYRVCGETIQEVFHASLFLLLHNGKQVNISKDKEGKRSGGQTLELQNLFIEIPEPDPLEEINLKSSKVTEKFHDGMLLCSTKDVQSRRIIQEKSRIIEKLSEKKDTRRAVITVWENTDLFASYAPCITSMQFLVRDNSLHQTAFFRSHDIWNAFPWNTKGNITFQADIAEKLDLGVGSYIELATSAHIYEVDKNKVNKFI